MKKIFAFILATIMVLSLVPASVFAAVTNADCSAGHDPDNSTAIKSVPATCTQAGYTVYVCGDCGEQYLGNFVEVLDHNWISDKENAHKDIAASCVYKTNGVKYVICADCKTTDVQEVSWNSTSVHNLTYVSGVGCEKLYACSICKAEGYIVKKTLKDTAAHDWKYDSVLEEPYWEKGVANDGLALYVCEECGDIKKVPIFCSDCAHADKTLVVAPVAATCTVDGTYAVYECDACLTLFVDKNADNNVDTVVYEALTDVNGDEKITKEDAVIATPGHTAPVTFTTAGCTRSYTCTVCKQAVVEEWHASYTETIAYAPTCVTFGVSYRACTTCGMQWPVMTDPLGHTTATLIVASNCAVQGGRYTYCTNANCPLVPTPVKDNVTGVVTNVRVVSVELFPLDSSKHDLVDSMATTGGTASCTTSSLHVWTCRNNCAEYAQPKVEYTQASGHTLVKWKTIHNCSAASATLGAWTTRTILKCEDCSYTTEQVDPITGKTANIEVADSSITTTFTNLNEALEYHGNLRRIWGYNDDDELVPTGEVEWRDNYSADNCTLTPVPSMNIAATCVNAGRIAYICSSCGIYAFITVDATAHTPVNKVEGYPATCNTPGLKDSYTCQLCGTTCDKNGKALTSLVINPCGSTLSGKLRDCASNGTAYYQCTVCNTCYTSTACTKKYIPVGHVWKNAYAGIVATCGTDGGLEVRYCNSCKLLEVNAVYMFDGEEVRVNFGSWANSYKKNAKSVAINDTNLVSKAVTVNIAKNGNVTFLCETVTSTTSPVIVNKINHYDPRVAHVHTDECAADCAQVFESLITTETNVDKTTDHKEAVFTKYMCEACEYEYIGKYVPAAGGHINEAGSILTTECENEGVKGDRVCKLCKAAGLSEEEYTITVAHNFSSSAETSTMTCQKDGYTYNYCRDCGFYSVSGIEVANAKTYHNSIKGDVTKMEKVGPEADYAHDGSYYYACPECGTKLTDLVESKCKGEGVEIYLSTDAETYMPGSKVYVTVTLDSFYGVDVWGLSFPITYDPAVFKYVGYSFNTAESDFQTFTVNSVQSYITFSQYGTDFTKGDKGDAGVVNVVANAGDEVEIKGAQVLAVIEFEVVDYTGTAGDATFAVEAAEVVTGLALGEYVSAYSAYVVDYAKSTVVTYKPDVVNGKGKAVAVNAIDDQGKSVNDVTVGVAGFLNLDGKDGITMADAHALYALIYNNEYDVMADADFDGKVTAKDLNVLYNILTGKITVEEYLTPSTSELEEAPDDGSIPQSWQKAN